MHAPEMDISDRDRSRRQLPAPSKVGPLLSAGILLGTGLGGFVDGILLHQILQWHNMLSSTLPPTSLVDMKVNMVWDGLFHAFTWIVTAAGIVLLFRAGRRADVPWSGRILAGASWAGWGLFNFVEGMIDHQLLGIHHVHPGANELAWDIGFLVLGALQLVTGALAIRGAAPGGASHGGSSHGGSSHGGSSHGGSSHGGSSHGDLVRPHEIPT